MGLWPFQKYPNLLITLTLGRVGGRFLQRCKVRKPAEEQSSDLSLSSLFYTSQDLYVGAIVTLNKHTFLLTSADEYVFSYMERPDEREKVNYIALGQRLFPTFPVSNYAVLEHSDWLENIKWLVKALHSIILRGKFLVI